MNQWSDLHERRAGYGDFPGRHFLNSVVRSATTLQRSALVYGCGTGGSAVRLAELGYRVTAVDLVPDAITLARQHARQHGVEIEFAVQDVCRWGSATTRYDIILDDFCLQSIVTHADRSRLYVGVHDRLERDGRYLITCAVHDPARDYSPDQRDDDTGIVWTPTDTTGPDSVTRGGRRWLPNRRHLSADALRAELEGAGFAVLEQQAGEVVCGHVRPS